MSAAQHTDRRIANIVQIGTVEQVQLGDVPRARVRVGELLTGWLRMSCARAGDAHVHWTYSVGEEVVIASMSGDLRQGVILGALSNGAAPSEASDATYLARFPNGVSVEVSGGVVSITAPGAVHINGDVIVSGDVVASGVSLVTHVHADVTPGLAKTGVPS